VTVKRTTPKKLAIRRENLRLLSNTELHDAACGGMTATRDWCSTESLSKCMGVKPNPCRHR
jgi:hypothetical protein